MKIIEKKEYPYREILMGDVVENILFKSCKFDNCMLSYLQTDDPAQATILRNCQFINCVTTDATSQIGGIIENVLFKNLKISSTLFISNVLFSNVTFKGKIGKLSLSSKMEPFAQIFDSENNRHQVTQTEMQRFDAFRMAYYQNTNWALDISEAVFSYCEIDPSIPAHLVKKNPETQVVIKYTNIADGQWKENERLANSILTYRFQKALDTKSDVIFVAPEGNKKDFHESIELIKILRGEGISELD